MMYLFHGSATQSKAVTGKSNAYCFRWINTRNAVPIVECSN